MNQFTDHQLIQRYLLGDEKSFDILVERYMRPIYGFVYKYVRDKDVAEDITQDVFLKVFRHIKKIDPHKSFKSWMYTIAKNTALDFLKKKKAIPLSAFQTAEGNNILVDKLQDTKKLPDVLSQMLENKNIFLLAIKNLSEKYQSVLYLYYYQYLNFREIAQALKEPINTIKSRHRRGLLLLKSSVGHSVL